MELKIKTYINPSKTEQKNLLKRGIRDITSIKETVKMIFAEVEHCGDKAVIYYEKSFDCPTLDSLTVGTEEILSAANYISTDLKTAINTAYNNIYKFHYAQKMDPIAVETMQGILCTQKTVAINSVGLYIPGGNAPLFSTVLMLAIPAKIAGCKRIALCTPPNKEGKINPAILYTANLCGITEIYKVGGAQAIASLTIGTESIKRVNKIFGPGNSFVMQAKMLANEYGVAVDMPAGPSEVMIIADKYANPSFVAADFLSQAEHGPDSQSILITTDKNLPDKVNKEINNLIEYLPTKEMIMKSLAHSYFAVFDTDQDVMDFANLYAPEHLIINHHNYRCLSEKVENAGSVFLGQYACESAGDYASGTNHTLPTSGYATAFSGVNLDSFTKKITFQTISQEGIATLGPTIETMAENENLFAHKLAATIRIEQVKKELQ